MKICKMLRVQWSSQHYLPLKCYSNGVLLECRPVPDPGPHPMCALVTARPAAKRSQGPIRRHGDSFTPATAWVTLIGLLSKSTSVPFSIRVVHRTALYRIRERTALCMSLHQVPHAHAHTHCAPGLAPAQARPPHHQRALRPPQAHCPVNKRGVILLDGAGGSGKSPEHPPNLRQGIGRTVPTRVWQETDLWPLHFFIWHILEGFSHMHDPHTFEMPQHRKASPGDAVVQPDCG